MKLATLQDAIDAGGVGSGGSGASKVFSKSLNRGKAMTAHTLAALYAKGYRLKKFTGLNRPAKGFDPIGVGLFEKNGAFFESVIYERFGQWLYATPEKLVRGESVAV